MKTLLSRFCFSVLIGGSVVLLNGCNSKDDDQKQPAPQPGAVELEFQNNYTDDTRLILSQDYTSKSSETIKIDELYYLVSNVKLHHENGSVYSEPDSYHLIKVTPAGNLESFALNNILGGEYTHITFSVGVDPERNKSFDNQVGDLALANHMTWDWSTGYKFLVIRGRYLSTTSGNYELFNFEIGTDANYKTITLPFPEKVGVNGTGSTSKVHLMADIKTIFGGANTIHVNATPLIDGTFGMAPKAAEVAANYSTMFKVHHIH